MSGIPHPGPGGVKNPSPCPSASFDSSSRAEDCERYVPLVPDELLRAGLSRTALLVWLALRRDAHRAHAAASALGYAEVGRRAGLRRDKARHGVEELRAAGWLTGAPGALACAIGNPAAAKSKPARVPKTGTATPPSVPEKGTDSTLTRTQNRYGCTPYGYTGADSEGAFGGASCTQKGYASSFKGFNSSHQQNSVVIGREKPVVEQRALQVFSKTHDDPSVSFAASVADSSVFAKEGFGQAPIDSTGLPSAVIHFDARADAERSKSEAGRGQGLLEGDGHPHATTPSLAMLSGVPMAPLPRVDGDAAAAATTAMAQAYKSRGLRAVAVDEREALRAVLGRLVDEAGRERTMRAWTAALDALARAGAGGARPWRSLVQDAARTLGLSARLAGTIFALSARQMEALPYEEQALACATYDELHALASKAFGARQARIMARRPDLVQGAIDSAILATMQRLEGEGLLVVHESEPLALPACAA